jgi:hypothetical protein
MQGVITGGDVVRNTFTILHLWGPSFYARCLFAVASGRRTTFLDLLCETEAPARVHPAARRPL